MPVRDDEAVKCAIGLIGVVESEETGLAARFEQRSRPASDLPAAALLQHVAELRAFPARLSDRQPVERQRHVACQHVEKVLRESDEMHPQAAPVQLCGGDVERANLARLKGDHGRKEPFTIAEPLVETLLGAVRRARHTRRRQRLFAPVDKQRNACSSTAPWRSVRPFAAPASLIAPTFCTRCRLIYGS
uniref:Uncharacterized protein n=1 Tax=Rhizobium meliloti TaxID=382 RepID=Q52954_RHIML|nr:ORF2 [Sinorhizobium meliloti]